MTTDKLPVPLLKAIRNPKATEADLVGFQKAYLKALKHLSPAEALTYLFVFGFDKHDDLPTGKTQSFESLKDYVVIIEKCQAVENVQSLGRRKKFLVELSKRNSVPERIVDCFHHLGYLNASAKKAPKGAIDPKVFFPMLFVALMNKRTKLQLEKQIAAGSFQFPKMSESLAELETIYKETSTKTS